MFDPSLYYAGRQSMSVIPVEEIMAGRDPYEQMLKDWETYQEDVAAEEEISTKDKVLSGHLGM